MGAQKDKASLCKSRIKKIHIDRLKGLYDLEIDLDKSLTAIMGVNGIGKSTVLHALACAFQPDGNGDNHIFPEFFPPNTDATWKDSKFDIEMENFEQKTIRIRTKTYEKQHDRWTPRYKNRPMRNVYYIGINTCVPDIEKEKLKGKVQHKTKIKSDKVSDNIIKDAAYIMNKDYKTLMENNSRNRSYLGLETKSNLKYSSLSRGTGEQRTIRILQIAYAAEAYSLLLIDEIDLLMHVLSLKRLIECLYDIAEKKYLQVIFTTHSLVVDSLKQYLDVRYLENISSKDGVNKTLVYSNISQDLIYSFTGDVKKTIHIYVEDELAKGIIKSIVSKLQMSSKVDVLTYGAATNAFTLAAGMILKKEKVENDLIVLDGDCYRSDEERLKQIEKSISGTEIDIEEKRKKALDIIEMFNLPDDTPPEKFLHTCLLECEENEKDEIIKAALEICAVKDSHEWIENIRRRVGESEEIVARRIVSIVSKMESWDRYVMPIEDWLKERSNL